MSRPVASECLLEGFIQIYQQDAAAIRTELIAGLLAEAAFVHPKFFYDGLGSKLFEAICELPEYYPTRTEAAIFSQNLVAMADVIGTGATLIDLGAGNCVKAASLFEALLPSQYVPIDISIDFLRTAVAQIKLRHPSLPVTGIGMDFSQSLALPDAVSRNQRLFFYPGSSIGNFSPERALTFLRSVHQACGTDVGAGLLIGVDLIKDKPILDAAYDDALGVTAAFNLNLLRNINAVLGANFVLQDWCHRGFFNPVESRIEMHLEARCDTEVVWPEGSRRFVKGERIHTENSYKYTREGFVDLLKQAGFVAPQTWADERGWFLVCHALAN